MTRFLIKLISRITLGCACLLLLAFTLGRILPAEAEIVYAATLNQRDFDIFRMAIYRHLVAVITHASGNNIGPVWSPDGQHIALISNREGVYSLYDG